ncbi:MAG: serine/threonine-protein phosphatase [Ketobacter sp.]|nr:serine/threonine-protein phosphatase [Ketobacter sp.]
MNLRYQSAALSHVGNVRELNEDAFCDDTGSGVWCVADGMGGYDAGEVASAMVVNAVTQAASTLNDTPTLQQKVEAISNAIQSVNDQLTQERTLTADSSMMGCTVIALMTQEQEGVCVWAGDSRLYLLRDNGLYQLSKDHSVVQELLDKGVIADQDIGTHPQRHVITRAVGADVSLELDYLAIDLLPEDVLLLCSDGLYSELQPDQIMSVLSAPVECEEKASRLIEAVLSGNASDNVTVNVIAVEQG